MQNRLRVLRAERNWSQARLAEELRVSRQTVNAIEAGKTDPALSIAFELARIFNTEIEKIFSAASPPSKPQPKPAVPRPVQQQFELDVTLI
jgi:putative transcriptional regulator